MRILETKLEQLNLTMEKKQEEENVILNEGEKEDVWQRVQMGSQTPTLETEENQEKTEETLSIKEISDPVVLEQNSQERNTEEVVETMAQNYYYVEEGDTLLSISLKIYQSGEYVQDIKEVNQLEDENYIKIGQKLILPPQKQ